MPSSTLPLWLEGRLRGLGLGPLSRKTLWVVAGKGVQFVAWLAMLAVLARRLDKPTLGLFQQGWLLIGTLTPILLLGLPQGINYILPRATREERRQAVWLGMALVAGAALVVGGVFMLDPALAAQVLGNRAIAPLAGVVIFAFWANLLGNFIDPLAIFAERQKYLLLVQTLYWVIFAAIGIGIGSTGNLPLLFLALGALGLAETLVTLLFAQKHFGLWDFGINPRLLRQMAHLAAFLGPVAVIDVLSVQIDKYVVSHWFGPEKFVIYSYGSLEIPFIPFLVGSVTATLLPELSLRLHESREGEALRMLQSSMEKLGWLIIPLFCYLLFFGPRWIPLVFGKGFERAVPVFLIFLCLVPLRSLNLHPIFVSGGLQKYLLRGRILDVTLNFFGSIALAATPLGVLGPAVAAVGATFVHKIYQTRVYQWRFQVPFSQLYPWQSFFRIGGWTLAGAALSSALVHWLGLSALAQALLGSALFAVWYGAWFRPWRREIAPEKCGSVK